MDRPLAEGSRALTKAGRWQQALAHAEHHNGIGQRLLDGRQTAVLTSALRGGSSSASALLDKSVSCTNRGKEPSRPACMSSRADTSANRSTAPYPTWSTATSPCSPRTEGSFSRPARADRDRPRGRDHPPDSAHAANHLIHHATSNIDGYAARELLKHAQERLSHSDREALLAARKASEIDCNPGPNLLTTTLLNALEGHEQQRATAIFCQHSERVGHERTS